MHCGIHIRGGDVKVITSITASVPVFGCTCTAADKATWSSFRRWELGSSWKSRIQMTYPSYAILPKLGPAAALPYRSPQNVPLQMGAAAKVWINVLLLTPSISSIQPDVGSHPCRSLPSPNSKLLSRPCRSPAFLALVEQLDPLVATIYSSACGQKDTNSTSLQN